MTHADAIADYRLATARLANSPTHTFLCAQCKSPRGITGRKKLRVGWACKACVEAGN